MQLNLNYFVRVFMLKLWFLIFNYPLSLLTAILSMMIIYRASQKKNSPLPLDKRLPIEDSSSGTTLGSSGIGSLISNSVNSVADVTTVTSSSNNNNNNNWSATVASIYSSSSDDETEKPTSRFTSFINYFWGGGKTHHNVDDNISTTSTSSENSTISPADGNHMYSMFDNVDSNDPNQSNLLRCPPKLLEDPMKLLGRTVLMVGGCCEGVGYEIAYALAQLGARKVVLACANEHEAQEAIEKMTDISRGVVEFMHLDLSSIQSIRQFVNFYQNVMNYECHVLVSTVLCTRQSNMGKNTSNNNNSRQLQNQFIGPRFTKDGYEKNFQLNYLGRIILIDMMSDMLKRNHTRVVNVVEILSESLKQQKPMKMIPNSDLNASTFKKAYTEQDYFNYSMRCNLLWIKMFAKKYQQDGVTICCCDPELPGTYKPPIPDIINQPTSTSSLLSDPYFMDPNSHDVLSITNEYAEEITNFDKIQSLLYGSLCDKQYFENGAYITNYRTKKLPSSYSNKKDMELNWEQTASLVTEIQSSVISQHSSPSISVNSSPTLPIPSSSQNEP